MSSARYRWTSLFSLPSVIVLLSTLLVGSVVSNAQLKHWTETSSETLWRGRYSNCDHGYVVHLPVGVVGHDSLPPLPNHGILISPENPGTTDEVTLEASRVLTVYDSSDAAEIGSAKGYLEQYDLKPRQSSEDVKILTEMVTRFRGAPAIYVHLRRKDGNRTSEVDELVIYRKPRNIGPQFNVIELITTPESYLHDHALFVQIEDGLRFIPVPRGECSND